VVPLGGLREFGMNTMLVSWGETSILVDAGVAFPDPELHGVDLIVPDLAHLEATGRRLSALVLTHGHEDHIGAVPYVWPLLDGPVLATALTLALVEPKLDEHGIDAGDRLVRVSPRERVQVGPLAVEFIRVTHSMPDCVALAIHTPAGTIVHTGDFKVDQTPPDGERFDLHRFAELGAAGVLALFADSTNVDRKGVAGSEFEVVDAFEEIFTSTRGKVVVALFASSLYRMQIVADLADQFQRKVAFVGRGVVENSEIAQRLGLLKIRPGQVLRDSEVRSCPPGEVACITTGSQGEPQAALSRIAIDDHRHVRLGPEDTVVFSARAIPGNEKAIGRVMNHIAARGADLVYEGIKHVHVSGHGSDEELKLVLSLVRPRVFVPIHGEYRHLARHAHVATQVCPDTQVLVAQNGDVIRFGDGAGEIAGRVPSGRVLIDGTRTGEIAGEVLRDRRHVAADGLLVPVLAINRQTGAIEGVPDVIPRGFVVDERSESVLAEAPSLLADIVEAAGLEERTDLGLIRERVRVELQRVVRRRSGRRPLVVPVVMEV
jgi:ribonuclease J